MPKKKLTLYIDEDAGRLAKKNARLYGKSISSMVQDYFKRRINSIHDLDIDDSIKKWIGIIEPKGDYKKLREDMHIDRLKKYENSD